MQSRHPGSAGTANRGKKNRVIRKARPSPIRSLPIEIISKILGLVEDYRFVARNWRYRDVEGRTDAYGNRPLPISRSALSVSRIFRDAGWSAFYKNIAIYKPSELTWLASMDSRDIKLKYVEHLWLDFTRSTSSFKLDPKQILELRRFHAKIPNIKKLNLVAYEDDFLATYHPMLIRSKKLEYLQLRVKVVEDADDAEYGLYADITIEKIPLDHLQELVLHTSLADLLEFFGPSIRPALKKLTLNRYEGYDAISILHLLPNLEELIIKSWSEPINALPQNLKKLTLSYGGATLGQFKKMEVAQRCSLTHLTVDEMHSGSLEDLPFLPSSIQEFVIKDYKDSHDTCDEYGDYVAPVESYELLMEALEGMKVGDILVKKIVFGGFMCLSQNDDHGDESEDEVENKDEKIAREAAWSRIEKEFVRIEVEVERRAIEY